MPDLVTVESKLRRLLRQAGEWVESRFGREQTKPDHRQLANRLTSKLQEAIDRAAQPLEDSERLWISGDIAVLLDYNTFAQLDPPSLNALADELRDVARDTVANRHYEAETLAVRISYDPLLAEPIVRVAAIDRPKAPLSGASALSGPATAVPASGYFLLSITPGFSLEFPFPAHGKKRTIVSIGRSADNTLSVNHGSVSKFHATLGIDPDGTIAIADMGSTNGTFLNRERVHGRTLIHPGDVVTLGEIDFRLEHR